MVYSGSDSKVKAFVDQLGTHLLPEEYIAVDADSCRHCPDHSPQNKILISDEISSRDIVSIAQEGYSHHIVQLSNFDPKRQVHRLAQFITDEAKVFSDPAPIILNNSISSQYRIPILSRPNSDKLDDIYSWLNLVPKLNSALDSAFLITQELIMNASKDAPYYYEQTFGQKKTFPSEGQPIGEFIAAHDGQRLMIAAVDHFGSLNLNKLLNRLSETYRTNMVSPLCEPSEGAGLGCRMIIELSTEIYFAVSKGNKTFVASIIPLGMSLKRQQLMPKNLHLFEIKK